MNKPDVTDIHAWIEEFPGSITVCDQNGMILVMNQKASDTFADQGGSSLIGSNLLDCHPEPSRSILKELMQDQKTNIYTVEKGPLRKMVYQTPWYRHGVYAGFVELAFEIPFEIPNRIR